MTYNFSVSPDFSPEHLSEWFIFNTWLQKALGVGFHLELYDDFKSQREAIEAGDKLDLLYANPYDAALLVREKGFVPLVKPDIKADEVVIAVHKNHPAEHIEDLLPGIKLAYTEDPDVQMMGMILLEAADLDQDNISMQTFGSNVLVAKAVFQQHSDVGFFLAEAYDDLSSVIKRSLKVLVRSDIQVIHHALMLGPKLMQQKEVLLQALLAMNADPGGQSIMKNLGFENWMPVDDEAMEFMIDLMDTLMV